MKDMNEETKNEKIKKLKEVLDRIGDGEYVTEEEFFSKSRTNKLG